MYFLVGTTRDCEETAMIHDLMIGNISCRRSFSVDCFGEILREHFFIIVDSTGPTNSAPGRKRHA